MYNPEGCNCLVYYLTAGGIGACVFGALGLAFIMSTTFTVNTTDANGAIIG